MPASSSGSLQRPSPPPLPLLSIGGLTPSSGTLGPPISVLSPSPPSRTLLPSGWRPTNSFETSPPPLTPFLPRNPPPPLEDWLGGMTTANAPWRTPWTPTALSDASRSSAYTPLLNGRRQLGSRPSLTTPTPTSGTLPNG